MAIFGSGSIALGGSRFGDRQWGWSVIGGGGGGSSDLGALVAAAAHALRQEDMDPRRHIRAAKECLDQALQALEGPERVLWLDDWR